MNENPFLRLHSSRQVITRTPIKPADRNEPIPLSYQQERLWFLDQLDRNASAPYHVEGALQLIGAIDGDALASALEALVARHETLRTRFVRGPGGEPHQVIAPTPAAAGFRLVRSRIDPSSHGALDSHIAALLEEPFDLTNGPLFRAHLVEISETNVVLVLGGHHTVVDGWSVGLVLKELSLIYRTMVAGDTPTLPVQELQYADYAVWQRSVLTAERLATETAWWRDRLAGAPEPIALPTDRPRPERPDHRGRSIDLHIASDLRTALAHRAAEENATLFMILQAALATLLSRLGAGDDLIIGTAVAGRGRPELEPLIGFFANTLAFRHRVDQVATFREVLRSSRNAILAGFDHQLVPFDQVVNAARPRRSSRHTPLVQVVLLLQNMADADNSLWFADAETWPYDGELEERLPFELALEFRELDGELVGRLAYHEALFDHATAERIAAQFLQLLNAISQDADRFVEDYEILLPKEREHIFGTARATSLPLTAAQTRLYVANQLLDDGEQAMVAEAISLTGALDERAMASAIAQVLSEFEVLRARVAKTPEGLRIAAVELPRTLQLLVHRTDGKSIEDALSTFKSTAVLSSTIGQSPLQLLKISATEWVVLHQSPDFAVDSYTIQLVAGRLADVYNTIVRTGTQPKSEPRRLEDALAYERSYRRSTAIKSDRERLLAIAKDPRPGTSFGGLSERRAVRSLRVEESAMSFSSALFSTADDLGVTRPALLLALTTAYLARLHGTPSVGLTLIVHGRLGRRWHNTSGPYSNFVPVRLAMAENANLKTLARDASRAIKDAIRHQRYRYEDLRRDLSLTRDQSDQFGAMVNIQAFDYGFECEGAVSRARNLSNAASVRDAMLSFFERGDGSPIDVVFEGHPALYTENDLQGHVRRIEEFSASALATPGATLFQHEVLSEAEASLVRQISSGAPEPNGRQSVIERFEAMARQHPDRVAVIDRDNTLTFGSLDAAANRLAMHLNAHGVAPGDVVGVCLERAAALIVTLFAVWKAGGVFLPLDPRGPRDRIGSICRDAGAFGVVCDDQTPELGETLAGIPTISLASPTAQSAPLERPTAPTSEPRRSVQFVGDRVAYILYTSGSTGMPKGVVVGHRALTTLTANQVTELCVTPQARVAQASAATFDAFFEEVMPALTTGATLVVVPFETLLSGQALHRLIERAEVSILVATPSILRTVPDAAFNRLDIVASTGETLPPSVAATIAARTCCLNTYGPTETTVTCTSHVVDLASGRAGVPGSVADDSVSIGRPFAGVQTYVVNPRLELMPVGVPGELLIGGQQVAFGYLGQAGQTAEKFVADPFSGNPGARLYRSGDRVRFRADGTLDFLGRMDTQVKIRGVRIEPGEIEAQLKACPGVAQAAVVTRLSEEGVTTARPDAQLIAYIVPERVPRTSEGPAEPLALADHIDLPSVRRQLEGHLLDAMIPDAFVGLTRLPLTVSGKVDRNGLPAVPGDIARSQPEPPQGDGERAVALVIETLLGFDGVGRNDDFFALGGHSLLAVRLVARFEAETGKTLSLRSLFAAPTVAEIAANLTQGSERQSTLIAPADRTMPLPLSFQQERLWFLDQLDKAASAAYHTTGTFELEGPLDRTALTRALNDLVARHEALRTTFAAGEDGVPFTVVAPTPQSAGFRLTVEAAEKAPASTLQQRITAWLHEPFELSQGPLFRALLLVRGPYSHRLVVSGHHIVLDGWSVALLLRDAGILYRDALTGRPSTLEPLSLQYTDYAAWQRQMLSGPDLAAEIDWWRDHLSGAPDAITMPFDRPRPKIMDYRGDSVSFCIPAEVAAPLKALAIENGATLYMVLHCAFAALLTRLGAGDDVVIGTGVAGRPHNDLEPLVGFFVNTVAIRTRTDLYAKFDQNLITAKADIVAALEHQLAPFEAVVDAVGAPRSLSRNPVVQVMLILQNTPEIGEALDLEGVAVNAFSAESQTSKYDLAVALKERAGGLDATLVYATQLFDRDTAEGVAAMFARLLAGVSKAPSRHMFQHSLIGEETTMSIPGEHAPLQRKERECSVLNDIDSQMRARPDAIAVVDGALTLTHRALDEASTNLGRVLAAKEIGIDSVVAVCLHRSADMIISLLAIWKAGAGYLLLDPDYPSERLDYMYRSASAQALLTNASLSGAVPSGDAIILGESGLSQPFDDVARGSPHDGTHRPGRRCAYIVFTSGSTGQPKGTQTEYASFSSFMRWMKDCFGKVPKRSLLRTPPAYNAINREIWFPLVTGGSVHIYRSAREETIDAAIAKSQVDYIPMVPSIITDIVERGRADCFGNGAIIYYAGEVLGDGIARTVLNANKEIILFNGYGASETTMPATGRRWSTDAPCPTSNIGRPIAGNAVYVVDPFLSLQPVGVPGELLIGGEQISRGYIQRPGLTSQQFIADPFSGVPGARLYRTGDMGRWRPDGTIEFLGRIDTQVRVRGMRVELGEIESTLCRCEGVAQAVVVPRKDAFQQTRLVAYIVPEVGRLVEAQSFVAHRHEMVSRDVLAIEDIIDLSALRHTLLQTLPEHMVPSGYVGLSHLPLTASKKVDRKALPVAEVSFARSKFEEPVGHAENSVAAVFRDLLEVDAVGRHDDFFALGGHSLLAVPLSNRLAQTLRKTVPVRAVFEAPRVADLAALLQKDAKTYQPLAWLHKRGTVGAPQPERRQRVTKRPTVVCFHPVTGRIDPYAFPPFRDRLSMIADLLAVECRGVSGPEPFFQSYEEMLECYCEALRAELPDGPTAFLGWSMGGFLAYDVARSLSTTHPTIDALVILDSALPDVAADPSARAGPHQDFDTWLADTVRTLAPHVLPEFEAAPTRAARFQVIWSASRPDVGAAETPVPDSATIEAIMRTWYHNAKLLSSRSQTGRFEGNTLVVIASDTRTRVSDRTLNWRRSCPSLDTTEVDHIHGDLFSAAAAPHLASTIVDWLNNEVWQ